MHLRHGFLAALAALGFLAAPARADRLDEELHKRMPDVVKQLKKHGTAGVLRFRVKEGSGRESFSAPLSGRMVEKLEMLLMAHNADEEKDALKLIRDAGVVASQKGIRSFSEAANREKLFRQRYPLMWGTGTAPPNVFLTGMVELSQNRVSTKVTLQTFDAKNVKSLKTLVEFDFPTDRHVLRDLGHGFELSQSARERLALSRDVIPRSGDKRGAFEDLADKIIVEEVNKKQPVKGASGIAPAAGAKKPPVAASATNVGGISVEMLVNGKPADINPSVGEGVKLEVTCPKPKDKIVFRLKNPTDKLLGVVLQLNGVNTLDQQKLPAEKAYKWVLPSKTKQDVEGFMIPEGKVDGPSEGKVKIKWKPFQVLVGEDATKRGEQFGDKKGLIEIDVFEDVGGKSADKPAFSARGLPPSKEHDARKSYQGLRSAVLKSTQLKTVVKRDPVTGGLSRVLIVESDDAVPGGEMERRDMKNPKIVAHLPIRVEPNDDMKKD